MKKKGGGLILSTYLSLVRFLHPWFWFLLATLFGPVSILFRSILVHLPLELMISLITPSSCFPVILCRRVWAIHYVDTPLNQTFSLREALIILLYLHTGTCILLVLPYYENFWCFVIINLSKYAIIYFALWPTCITNWLAYLIPSFQNRRYILHFHTSHNTR